MKTQFTPGPWAVSGIQITQPAESFAGKSVRVAMVYGERPTQRQRSANARLIAAAPELYAALQGMVDRYGPDHSTLQTTPWDRAVAALAKVAQ